MISKLTIFLLVIMIRDEIKVVIKKILGKNFFRFLVEKYFLLKLRTKNKELYRSIKENRKLFNIHRGKRCFILGNGPSLKNIDLELLSNEVVFTVNRFSRVKNFELAKPNYHLWIDFAFFDLRDDQKLENEDLFGSYYDMSKTKATCFVPAEAYPFIKKNKLDEILDIHYLLLGMHNVEKSTIQYELDKFITTYSTVVQYAIAIAIYMGFKEIYLLGCDSTSVVSIINNALNIENVNAHAYDNDVVNNTNKQILSVWAMSEIFHDQYALFHGYKALFELAQKRNIILRNCSNPTLINEIPRTDIIDVLKK